MAFLSINRSDSSVDMLASDVNIAFDNTDDYSEDDKTVTSDNLTLSLLVCSSTNFTVIFTYWTYLLYSSFIQNTSWPSLFPNLLLFGLFLGSSSSLAYITLDPASPTSCISSTLVPISYTIIYSTLPHPKCPDLLHPHPYLTLSKLTQYCIASTSFRQHT